MGSQEYVSEAEYWYFEGKRDGYYTYDSRPSVPYRYLDYYLEGVNLGELEKCQENEQDVQEFYIF